MADSDVLATAFEAHRDHLRAVAYRLLGSLTDAEDAVQDTWLRLTGADSSEIDNLGAWLTTVVARVCLNMLRSRRRHQEDPVGDDWPLAAPAGPAVGGTRPLGDPEDEAVLADSVGLALLVVLEMLSPAERLAFVLHDLFAMPFAEVAEVLGRSVESTRQLASRARRRVRGASSEDRAADLARQREVASAFLAAARGGDLAALVALLDTDVTLTADAAAAPSGRSIVLQGADAVSRGAILASSRAGESELALVDGTVGVLFAPGGELQVVLGFTINSDRRIAAIDVVADPDRLRRLRLTPLGG
ncbi:MAG TPA: sigma-70 family RNA polymerase sigma factor [Streptosporangiaceae bacterium]|nr:sigma-70 family RNA polymerase sigma factor [Streptosporangiaceae bacterium]